MITKVDNKITDLVEILGKNLSWNLARRKFIALFICSITKLQTVCFVKIAQDIKPDVKHESNTNTSIMHPYFPKVVHSYFPKTLHY